MSYQDRTSPKYQVGDIVWRVVLPPEKDTYPKIESCTITGVLIGLGNRDRKPQFVWYRFKESELMGYPNQRYGEDSFFSSWQDALQYAQKKKAVGFVI
jgi:hypothetical protein